MPSAFSTYSCRMCGATSYRRVIARDDAGALRATELYQCSGCSVVFADPKAWRDGDGADATMPNPPSTAQRPVTGTVGTVDTLSRTPNLATYGLGSAMDPPAE